MSAAGGRDDGGGRGRSKAKQRKTADQISAADPPVLPEGDHPADRRVAHQIVPIHCPVPYAR
jgi:hypothetical protein